MKTNKRVALLLGAVILAVGLLTAATALRRDAPPEDAVPPRPEDTPLELWICDDASGFDWSGHAEVPGMMGGRQLLGAGYDLEDAERVLYTLTAWPDYADGGCFVTRISVTDPAVTVYGLTVHSDAGEFEEVFTSLGFTVEPGDVPGTVRAVRDGIGFTLSAGHTPELTVSAQVTNWQGIEF